MLSIPQEFLDSKQVSILGNDETYMTTGGAEILKFSDYWVLVRDYTEKKILIPWSAIRSISLPKTTKRVGEQG